MSRNRYAVFDEDGHKLGVSSWTHKNMGYIFEPIFQFVMIVSIVLLVIVAFN